MCRVAFRSFYLSSVNDSTICTHNASLLQGEKWSNTALGRTKRTKKIKMKWKGNFLYVPFV
jgi:hypothetical protein